MIISTFRTGEFRIMAGNRKEIIKDLDESMRKQFIEQFVELHGAVAFLLDSGL